MCSFLLVAVFASLAGAEPEKPAVSFPAKGSAVTIELSNGSMLQGIYDGRREGAVWLKQDQGEIGIEPDTIASVRAENNPTAEFRRRLAAVDKMDATALWELASWAGDHGLDDSALELAAKVVKLHPEHAEARALLRHEKVGDEWMDRDSAMRALGFVEYKGRWVTQENYEQFLRDQQHQESNERIARLRYSRWYYYRSYHYPNYTDPYYRANRGMLYKQAMLNNPTALWEPYRINLYRGSR